jgi:ABC-type glycerol-3-phosphate transport system substrate-binding protein
MKRVSIVVLVVAFLFCSLFLYAGGDKETKEEAKPEKTVLNFWSWNNPATEWEKLMMDEFSKTHPDVEFVYHTQDQYKIRDTMGPALKARDKTLDCAHFYYGAVLKPIAEAGLVMDLSPYFEKYGWYDILFEGAEKYRIHGKPYIINSSLCTTPVIWYNVDMFEEVGVEPAGTMDELLAITKKIRAAGHDSIVAGFQTQWPLQHLFNIMAINTLGDADWTTLLESNNEDYSGRIKWTDSRIAETIDTIKWLYDNHVLSERCFALDFPASRGAIQGGEASMLTDGSWETVWLGAETEGKLNHDYFLWPSPNPDLPYKMIGTSADGWIIPSYSKDKADLIAEFYDFLLQKEQQIKGLQMGIATIRGDFTNAELEEHWDPKYIRLFNQDLNTYGFGEVSDIWLTTEFIDIMTTKIQEVVLEQTEPADALAELEALAEDIRNR